MIRNIVSNLVVRFGKWITLLGIKLAGGIGRLKVEYECHADSNEDLSIVGTFLAIFIGIPLFWVILTVVFASTGDL